MRVRILVAGGLVAAVMATIAVRAAAQAPTQPVAEVTFTKHIAPDPSAQLRELSPP